MGCINIAIDNGYLTLFTTRTTTTQQGIDTITIQYTKSTS